MRTFIELVERYVDPELCPYPEYKGKPYYSIKYIENGEEHVGYSSYSLQVMSGFLKKYFMSPALEKQEQDRWVPVSERPKKDGRYQVTRLDYVTDAKFIDNLWYEKNTWWNRQVTGDYAVTAWRPLPEPYTEDEA